MLIVFQMRDKELPQRMAQGIALLFNVTHRFTSSDDAGFKAEMMEKQMAYGILLQSCGLMGMTDHAFEKTIMSVKQQLVSKVSYHLHAQYFNEVLSSCTVRNSLHVKPKSIRMEDPCKA